MKLTSCPKLDAFLQMNGLFGIFDDDTMLLECMLSIAARHYANKDPRNIKLFCMALYSLLNPQAPNYTEWSNTKSPDDLLLFAVFRNALIRSFIGLSGETHDTLTRQACNCPGAHLCSKGDLHLSPFIK